MKLPQFNNPVRHTMPNRLALESSPYLRQHADNPVDWYPWGTEAFDKARREDKPVLLSVGYAACHWCHVMAHESFEDADTATLMNTLFVNIKVDREERPDVDAIYMQAVQAMTGHGGWPMTVALTASGEPFWGGTYFPLTDRPGMPSFKRMLQSLSDAWQGRRESVERTATAMREVYASSAAVASPGIGLEPAMLQRAFNTLAAQHDPVLGGFGRSPKFPQTMSLDFCLRWWWRSGNEAARDIAHRSFVAMMRGGIHDQVGGGFHRYSVDAMWLVPHFEKMLYDNALLARLGTHLWQVTRDKEIAGCVNDTITWLLREMTAASGGFFASLDADSEGHEGVFYVWRGAELDALLGDDAPVARAVWGVTDEGNFEGRSILHLPGSLPSIAKTLRMSEDQIREIIARAVATLYSARSHRVWPGRDEKILAGWNGLMTRALAEAARVFDRSDWLHAAVRNGEFLLTEMVRGGRVWRVHMDGVSKVPGFLEDHAAVALAFIALHEATLNNRWLHAARAIARQTETHFRDADGVWFDTADDAEQLITRPRETMDNAVPAGTSLALELRLRLAEVDGDGATAADVSTQLALQVDFMEKWPNGFGHLLGVADLSLNGAVAVALVGPKGQDDFSDLARVIADRYLPTLVLVAGAEAEAGTGSDAGLLAGRTALSGHTTAYVCRNFTCDAPTSEATELGRQLDQARHGTAAR